MIQDLLTMKQLVIEEANNIKVHATSEEIARLNTESAKSNNRGQCVYGQMTGDCYGDRAYDLITKCATKVYNLAEYEDTHIKTMVNATLNGAPYKLESAFDRGFKYHSPIETFILSAYGGKSAHHEIIRFIKGEINDLKL